MTEIERARWWVHAWTRYLSYLMNHPLPSRPSTVAEERKYLYECERVLYKHRKAHERLRRAFRKNA